MSRGGSDFVKVLDFGVAKLHDTLEEHETSAGAILGTPRYMAPEQAFGREVDRHADVWAAGVVLYELLSGAVPFTAPSFVELATCIREDTPEPLPKKTPRGERIPVALDAAVMRCLEKRPGDRFRSMSALAEALRALLPSSPRARRRPRWALGGVAVAAALLAGILAAQRHGAPELESAVRPAERAARALVEDVRVAVAPESKPAPSSARSATQPAAPAPQASPPARIAAKPQPAAPSAAPRRPRVELRLRSTPPGASVVRLDTHERLGRTPVQVDVPRKASRVWIRMRLDGYAPVEFAVDLRKDAAANVELRRLRKRSSGRRHARW